MDILALISDPIVKLLKWHWLEQIGIPSILFRLFLAVLCGGAIGMERAKKHQAAGLRTYIIVCLGSVIAMMTNEFLTFATNMADSARIAAQVISGIGFLGAGTILVTSRNQIRGLTTAAGLWACACLGLAIGTGFYTLAIFATIIIVVVLAILPKIESYITYCSKKISIHIEFQSNENLKEFVGYVRSRNFKILSIDNNQAYLSSGLSVYTISLISLDKNKLFHKDLLQDFLNLEYVNYAEEIY